MKQPLFSTSYAPRDGESTLDEIEALPSSPRASIALNVIEESLSLRSFTNNGISDSEPTSPMALIALLRTKESSSLRSSISNDNVTLPNLLKLLIAIKRVEGFTSLTIVRTVF